MKSFFGSVVLSGLDGSEERRSEILIKATSISLSPDRSRFAFIGTWLGDRSPRAKLALSKFAGNEVEMLAVASLSEPGAPFGARAADVDWSPDGRTLLFSDGGKIFTIDVQSREQRFITEGGRARWSPSGAQVSLLSARNEPSVLTVATGQLEVVDPGKRSNRPVEWSPDGRYLLIAEADGSHVPYGCLWVYQLAKKRWMAIPSYGIGGIAPQWIQLSDDARSKTKQ